MRPAVLRVRGARARDDALARARSRDAASNADVPEAGPTVEGRVRDTRDENAPAGCCHDVHEFHAAGALVASTLLDDGPKPVVPAALHAREHPTDFALHAGTFTNVEDVLSGEHTAWLTRLPVVAR